VSAAAGVLVVVAVDSLVPADVAVEAVAAVVSVAMAAVAVVSGVVVEAAALAVVEQGAVLAIALVAPVGAVAAEAAAADGTSVVVRTALVGAVVRPDIDLLQVVALAVAAVESAPVEFGSELAATASEAGTNSHPCPAGQARVVPAPRYPQTLAGHAAQARWKRSYQHLLFVVHRSRAVMLAA